jgi:hydroxymethylglutaryl-CoA synthase
MALMKSNKPVGIVGYGAYVPRYRLPASEVSRVWTDGAEGTPIKEKSVPGLDEDVATMSIEAARNALNRAQIDPQSLGAVWVGSESHPYAVKPTSTIVAEAIGAVPFTQAADMQFACKAGSEALQAAAGFVASGMVQYAMAIGMDTAQGRPGDALEYTAGAGGAAYIVGDGEEALAIIEGSLSFVTDTPDFWRRQYAHYPEHASRFTGEPAYFKHVVSAAEQIMEGLGTKPEDYTCVVFHQPNVKFPQRAAQMLGFKPEQYKIGLLVNEIGNTYAGSSLIGLTAILDVAKPGDRVLEVSFGSGAGSDAFSLCITDRITDRQNRAPKTRDYINRRTQIDYATYVRYRKKLTMV